MGEKEKYKKEIEVLNFLAQFIEELGNINSSMKSIEFIKIGFRLEDGMTMHKDIKLDN